MKLNVYFLRTIVESFGILAITLGLVSGVVGASEEGEVTQASQTKAIEAAEMEKGFRLRERAAGTLGVKFAKIVGSELIVETDGIVRFQDFTAVYRKRDGWIRMIEVDGVVDEKSGRMRFSSKDFQPGDEIAVNGAPTLRVIDMDLWGPQADACGD